MANNFFIPVSEPLKNIVHSFWQTKRDVIFQTETIIPKGIIEVIFDLSGNSAIEANFNNRQYHLERCFINGFNTNPVSLKFSGVQNFFGIRFHPIVIRKIFGIQPNELSNLTIDLTLIDPSVNSLWHQLAALPEFNERINIISKWLEKRWQTFTKQEELLNSFLNNTNDEIPSVKELSGKLFYSPRHLSRKLHAITGMNAEEILLYKKFQRSVSLIHFSDLSLTQIAYQTQFADQSHFIKTFREFAAITPGEYRKVKTDLPGHIFKDVR